MRYETSSSSQAKANRLKLLRRMVGLSRKVFAEKYAVSSASLQNWEAAKFGGLTEKGARLVIKALREEGVVCSLDWLMLGVGERPLVQEVKEVVCDNKVGKTSHHEDEIAHVLKMHPGAKSYVMRDDSMSPWIEVGDCLVAVEAEVDASIAHKVCILEFYQGFSLVRVVSRVAGKRVSFYAANMSSFAAKLHEDTEKVRRVFRMIGLRKATD